jgi:CRISPR/Cas system CMR-associated protein Cmr1 (group 7 of RAMP superfamily)
MPEFRPAVVRGMLRYGFWARSLGIYLQPECKTWEAELFGTIEPRTQEGKFSLRT